MRRRGVGFHQESWRATQADLARTYGVSQATISRLQPLPFEHASVAGA
jgi:predicted transcriptional regulator